jgi:hypothetical protein
MTSKAFGLAQLGNAYSDGALSNRNVIINGDLKVNQRNNVSGGNVGNGTYTYDRWVTVQTLSANTSDGAGYQNSDSLRMDALASASGQMAMEQKIETPSDFDGLVMTVSAWVKSNSSNCRLNIYDSGWNGIKSDAHTGGGDWEFLTASGTFDTGMTDLRVRIGLSNQGNTTISSGDYFDFTQAQLERGDTATPFEHRSYGQELALCQRYYQRYTNTSGAGSNLFAMSQAYTTTDVIAPFIPIVSFRAVPTISGVGWATFTAGGANGGGTSLSLGVGSSTNNLRIQIGGCTSLAAGNASGIQLSAGTGNYIDLSAEL